jgi:hypothetical protein
MIQNVKRLRRDPNRTLRDPNRTLARGYKIEDLARASHPETLGFHLTTSRFRPKVAAAWGEAGFYRRMNQKDNLLERARRAYACRCNRTTGIIYQRGSKSFNRIDDEVVIFDTIRGELAPHKSGPFGVNR